MLQGTTKDKTYIGRNLSIREKSNDTHNIKINDT